MNNLSMNTVLDIKIKGSVERMKVSDIYKPDMDISEDQFLLLIASWIQAGRATIVEPTKSKLEQMSDDIFNELKAINEGKAIEQDRIQKQNYNQGANGYYKKVGFPAKSLLDAQEMVQTLIKNFNLSDEQVGVDMKDMKILVTITNCPVKTYTSIERAFGFKRATEAVSDVVDKTAKSAINVTDMTLNNVAVPVAKTAISTTTKVAKSLFGFGAKLGGIAIGEVVKASKQCANEIKNDGYIAEARGEVIDGVHSVRRAFNSTSFGSNGGYIIE